MYIFGAGKSEYFYNNREAREGDLILANTWLFASLVLRT